MASKAERVNGLAIKCGSIVNAWIGYAERASTLCAILDRPAVADSEPARCSRVGPGAARNWSAQGASEPVGPGWPPWYWGETAHSRGGIAADIAAALALTRPAGSLLCWTCRLRSRA